MLNRQLYVLFFGICLVYLYSCSASKNLPQTRTGTTDKESPAPLPTPNPKESIYTPGISKTISPSLSYEILDLELSPTLREFRGVWIATVANIDWPTSPLDTYEKQKSDFIKILDHYQSMKFNAVIVQIRTSGDAFYPSKLAPWSRFLTGKEGIGPKTPEDLLSWMIQQAHQRGFEFHAWINPYRATLDLDTKKLSPEHDFFKHPNWMFKYADKYYYNPGLPEVQQHLVNVIIEIVSNYEMDAIHFDDYFYPYKVGNLKIEDGETFRKHAKSNQSVEDWRRDNVNTLVKEVYENIKSVKPWVQFGISPFGVWRNIENDPSGSKTRAGVTNFDELYADPITWMKEGWVDYLIPQLYWSMDFNLAPYRELVDWWSRNSHHTKIYIGNAAYKIRNNTDVAWANPMEIPNQISLSRANPKISGNAFFSARSLYQKNLDVSDLIVKHQYNQKAFPPHFQENWSGMDPPGINLVQDSIGYSFRIVGDLNPEFQYLVIYSSSNRQELSIKSPQTEINKIHLDLEFDANSSIPFSLKNNQRYIAVSFLDHFGRETVPKVFEIFMQ